MKKVYLFFFTVITFFSCSKKSDTHPNANSVTINGTGYSIAVIGSQTWTSVNYNGEGGVNYNNGGINNPANGKLYSITEAQAIKLPQGWRLPTKDDFNKLLVSIGAIYQNQVTGNYYASGDLSLKLMSTTEWTGTEGNNQSGFNARPVGVFFGNPNTSFVPTGVSSFFVVNYPSNQGVISFEVSADDSGLTYLVSDAATARQSVRFVKDN